MTTLTKIIKEKIFEGILVETLINYGMNVFIYSDLPKIRRIEDLNGYIVYTPIESKNSGHYVCLWFPKEKNGETNFRKLMYFDPFGFSPVETVRKSIYMLSTPVRDEDYLSNLMIDFKRRGGQIFHNPVQYQDLSYSTCGRHCLIRLMYSHLSHSEYENFLKFKNCNYDELVTIMTVSL